LGFEPGITDSKGISEEKIQLQIPTVASSSLPSTFPPTSSISWDKYKEYLYANLRPNTARLALKYGKKYSYVLEHMDINDLLILPPAKQRHIMKALANLAKLLGYMKNGTNCEDSISSSGHLLTRWTFLKG
jgi:hypothetical protein